jgi:hypothetical protein
MNKSTVLMAAVLAVITLMAVGITVPPSNVHGSILVTQTGEICSGNGMNTAQTVQNDGENKGRIGIECEDFAGDFE